MSGRFIVIEGPNGVGKTTVAASLAEHLRRRGSAVHVTREPSGTALGELVRSAESHLSGRALALAVAADRYAHLEQEVIPGAPRRRGCHQRSVCAVLAGPAALGWA